MKKSKTIIHVNKHRIRIQPPVPCIAVRNSRSGKARYARSVKINGPSEIVHSPEKPLKCGAIVWIETTADVELIGEEPHDE